MWIWGFVSPIGFCCHLHSSTICYRTSPNLTQDFPFFSGRPTGVIRPWRHSRKKSQMEWCEQAISASQLGGRQSAPQGAANSRSEPVKTVRQPLRPLRPHANHPLRVTPVLVALFEVSLLASHWLKHGSRDSPNGAHSAAFRGASDHICVSTL